MVLKIKIRIVNKKTNNVEYQEIDVKNKNFEMQLGSSITDINGNEVYEGDIVDIETSPDRWSRFHQAIKFENGKFNIASMINMNYKVRIVGNINSGDYNNLGVETK